MARLKSYREAPIAQFTFINVQAIGPDENILFEGFEDLSVRIYRSFRTTPFQAQPQFCLNGSVLGYESLMQMAYKGKAAVGYRFALKLNNKILQKGIIDQNGYCRDLKIGFPLQHRVDEYHLEVITPRKRPS